MEPGPDQLHPIIDDILDAIRKRMGEKDGKRVVEEEFILPEEFIPPLHEKLKAITDEEEKREALLSVFAFCMMVEKQGWPENAAKIQRLGEVLGDVYREVQQTVANRLEKQKAEKSQDFFMSDSQQSPTPEHPSIGETVPKKVFKPGLDDDFDD